MEWSFGWSQDLQTLERAIALTQKAIALDDSLPLAHMALGDICLYRKQHERAIAEGEKAITLNPNSAEAYAHLGFILTFAGNPEEAIRLLEKAMRLDPRYPFYYLSWLGFAYRSAQRYEEAIAAYRGVLARNPDWLHAHLGLAVTYSNVGQEDKARTEAAEVLRINPDCCLEVLRQVLPYRDHAQLERELAALRKAGLSP